MYMVCMFDEIFTGMRNICILSSNLLDLKGCNGMIWLLLRSRAVSLVY